MNTLLLVVHIVVCLFLIVIVLLQHGKGADIGATFGGSSQSLFGTEGPLPLLNKITTAAAVIFMLTSVTLAYKSAQDSHSSVMSQVEMTKTVAPQESKEVAPVVDKTKSTEQVKAVTQETTQNVEPVINDAGTTPAPEQQTTK